MSKFTKNWNRTDSRSFGEKVKDAFRSQGPLKPRIINASRKIEIQIQKMDNMLKKIKDRDNEIFKRIVNAHTTHDMDTAKALANELAEVRKLGRTINNSKLALEQINNRLNTVQDLGDAVTVMVPALNVMKDVRRDIARVMPEAENEIGDIGNALNSILIDTVSNSSFELANEAFVSEDVEKILSEAAIVAESNLDSKLPPIPNKDELPRSI